MKSIQSLLCTSFFLVLTNTFSSLAGDRVGNGGDTHKTEDNSAWFLGNRPIKTCLEVDDNFEMTAESIHPIIDNAFSIWRNYTTDKHLQSASSATPQLALRNEWLKLCDGTQDLAFYFGTTNAEVTKAKGKFTNPAAFSERLSYDKYKGWGHGFIWFSNPTTFADTIPELKEQFKLHWNVGNNLIGMLLHEIGHVLGNEHVSGTIMDERIVDLLTAGTFREANRLTQIDHNRELFRCGSTTNCPLNYSGQTDAGAFKLLTGRAPLGNVQASVFHRIIEGEKNVMVLSIGDDMGSYDYTLADLKEVSSVSLKSNVFTRSYKSGGSLHGVISHTRLTQLTTTQGMKRQVILNRNTDTILSLCILDNDDCRIIFSTKHWNDNL